MLQTSNDIRNPGLRTLPPGVERYFVKGGGLSIIEVSPEDKIKIINDEGRQVSEIIVFNSKGKSDLSILNLKENSNADFSKKTISNDEKISKILKKKNLDLKNAKASIIFDNDCVMGEKITLTSKDKSILNCPIKYSSICLCILVPLEDDVFIILSASSFPTLCLHFNNEFFFSSDSVALSISVTEGSFVSLIL